MSQEHRLASQVPGFVVWIVEIHGIDMSVAIASDIDVYLIEVVEVFRVILVLSCRHVLVDAMATRCH